jgi:DNA-binding SARP family transcriptional activator
MELQVLGPVRLTSAGKPLPLAPKPRALMALLAIHANRTVSIDRLVDGLWGEDSPLTAAKTLQTYVFLIRRQLAPDGGDRDPGLRIVTEGQGYRLVVGPAALDSRRFEELVRAAQTRLEADPRGAAEQLTEALSFWYGPPFADFAYETWAASEIERLEELRATAFEQLAQAKLLLGEHAQIVGDLQHAVSELPFREQLWASLMLALYRSGRRAEALLAFRDAEKALRNELGAEPGPELQQLAVRIRDGDPSLTGPRGAAAIESTRTVIPVTPTTVDDRSGPAAAAVADVPRRTTPAARGIVTKRSITVVGVLAAAAVAIAIGGQLMGGGPPRPTLSAADRELQRRLPLTIRDSCVPDMGDQPPLGLTAGLRCDLERGSAANYVRYWQFTSPEQFDIAIVSLIEQQHIPNGDCSREPKAVGAWSVGDLHAGRMLCYPASGGRWIVWTYDKDRIAALAFRNDDDWQELYTWARQLALFLRA